MANIVDILMKIQGDKAVFNSIANLSKEFQKLERNIGDQSEVTRKLSSSWDFVGGKLAGVGGIIAGAFTIDALVDFSKQTFSLADSLVTLSERTGQSTDFVQKMRFAAEQTGASVSTMDTALIKFNRTLGNVIQTGKDKVFKEIGVNVKNASGMVKDSEQIFNETIDAVSKLSNKAEQTSAIFKIFGKSASELIPTFTNGVDGLNKYGNELQNLGGVLDAEMIAKAEEAGDAINSMDKAIKGLTQSIILNAAPAISDYATKVSTLLGDINRGKQIEETAKSLQKQRDEIIKTSSSIQHAMNFWHNTGLEMEEVRKRANMMAEGIRTNRQAAEDFGKSAKHIQEWQGPLQVIAEGTIKATDSFRIINDEIPKLTNITNQATTSYQTLNTESGILLTNNTNMADSYKTITNEIDGTITLTNKLADDTKSVNAYNADNTQTLQDQIKSHQDLQSTLDETSTEYRKVTNELNQMQRAAQRADDILASMQSEMNKVNKSGAELERIRFSEDFEKLRKDIAATGDITKIEKFEATAPEFKKVMLDQINTKENAEIDSNREVFIEKTKMEVEGMTKMQQIEYQSEKENAKRIMEVRDDMASTQIRNFEEQSKDSIGKIAEFAKKSYAQAWMDSEFSRLQFERTKLGGAPSAGSLGIMGFGVSGLMQNVLTDKVKALESTIERIKSGQTPGTTSDIDRYIAELQGIFQSTGISSKYGGGASKSNFASGGLPQNGSTKTININVTGADQLDPLTVNSRRQMATIMASQMKAA